MRTGGYRPSMHPYDDDVTADMETLHDVRVLGVEHQGVEVVVDIYGSAAHLCGTVKFTGTRRTRMSIARTLRRWAHVDTPLTYVRHEGRVSLSELGADPRRIGA
jgi:hypothetical protein